MAPPRHRWLREFVTRSRLQQGERLMLSTKKFPYYDDCSLEALDCAFEAVWTTLKSHNPLHDWDADVVQKSELANILLGLAAAGITDCYLLRSRALDMLPVVPQNTARSARRSAAEPYQFQLRSLGELGTSDSRPEACWFPLIIIQRHWKRMDRTCPLTFASHQDKRHIGLTARCPLLAISGLIGCSLLG